LIDIFKFYSDSVINNQGFLASWRFLPESQSAGAGSQPQSYELSFPQSFAVSKDVVEETVCLKLNNVDEDGEVNVMKIDPDQGTTRFLQISFSQKS